MMSCYKAAVRKENPIKYVVYAKAYLAAIMSS